MNITIRPANLETDSDAIWNIFEQVISTGDTFSFAENTPRRDLEKWWTGPIFHVFVAEIEGKIVGSYFLKPNQPDRGSHVANAGYRAARLAGAAWRKKCAPIPSKWLEKSAFSPCNLIWSSRRTRARCGFGKKWVSKSWVVCRKRFATPNWGSWMRL